jgi:hypothetical protein
MTENELEKRLTDPAWRLRNFYSITDKAGNRVRFAPWAEQERLFNNLWSRNLILKARQRGFSTAIQILGLDTCLFNSNTNAAVIAHDLKSARKIFDKVKFAYENLPEAVALMKPLVKKTQTELRFRNGSSFAVTSSARSTTLQFLHLSEFGRMCAHFPGKAQEVVTGTLPAVAPGGMVFIESTAEGREGPFYEMVQKSRAAEQASKTALSRREFKFHFASWWDAEEYVDDPELVPITGAEHDYFNKLEMIVGHQIPLERRAWYICTRDTEFGGDWQLMKQEYPSIPEEAFEQSLEGVYYAEQLAAAQRTNRITDVPYMPGVPVNTFWDLGKNDCTSIWFHQHVNGWDHFINFFEASDQAFSFYTKHMQTLGYTWGTHYLPHDGEHRSWGTEQLKSARTMLEDLGLRNIQIVPRTPNLTIAIRQVRDAFPKYRFDQTRCKLGLHHLYHYRKAWNERLGAWSETPLPNGHQHAADAIRQHAQVYVEPVRRSQTHRRRRVSAMAV